MFGNTSIGIHGKELPKFKDALKEYWSVGKTTKSRSFIQPIEEEQKTFVPKVIRKDNFDKITNLNQFTCELSPPKINPKYKSVQTRKDEAKLQENKKLFDIAADNRESYAKYIDQPLFSSFVQNHKFPNCKMVSMSKQTRNTNEVSPETNKKSLTTSLRNRAVSATKERWVKTSGFGMS